MNWLKQNWFTVGKSSALFLALVFVVMSIFTAVSGKYLNEEELLWGAISTAILIAFLWVRLSKRFNL